MAIGRNSKAEARPFWLGPSVATSSAAVLFFLAAAIFVDRHFIGNTSPLFCDVPVYRAAVEAHAKGANPYDPHVLRQLGVPEYLRFTSPPIIDLAFYAIAHSPIRYVFSFLLTAVHIISVWLIPLVLGRLLFRQNSSLIILAVAGYFTLFAAAGVGALGAGNNGTALYAMIIMASTSGFRNSKWMIFNLAVLIAALFKPFYVTFWIIPVLAHGFSWFYAGIAFLGTAVAAISYLAFTWLDPVRYNEWLDSLSHQLFATGDFGGSILGAVRQIRGSADPIWVAYGAELLFIAGLGLLALVPLYGRKRWATLIVVAVFMNPRPMGYDISVAAIPLMFLMGGLMPRKLAPEVRFAVPTVALSAAMLALTYRTVNLVPAAVLFPAITIAILLLATLWQAGRAAEGSLREAQDP